MEVPYEPFDTVTVLHENDREGTIRCILEHVEIGARTVEVRGTTLDVSVICVDRRQNPPEIIRKRLVITGMYIQDNPVVAVVGGAIEVTVVKTTPFNIAERIAMQNP